MFKLLFTPVGISIPLSVHADASAKRQGLSSPKRSRQIYTWYIAITAAGRGFGLALPAERTKRESEDMYRPAHSTPDNLQGEKGK